MIKVEISEKPDVQEKPEYPLLAQSTNSPLLVLFTDDETGMVLQGNSRYLQGYRCADWGSAENKSVWKILPKGKVVTLTVE